MRKRIKLFGSIEKVEAQEDGTLMVSGIASSETVDGVGEIVRSDAMKAAIPDYMKFGAVREMHQPIAAGTAVSIEVDAAGLTHFEAHVVDESSVKKVNTGVLKGFSIGGRVTERDPLNKKIITALNLTEISLVDRPCNPDATFAIAKIGGDDDSTSQGANMDENEAAKGQDSAEGTGDTPSTPIQKGMTHIGVLAYLLKQISYLVGDQAAEAAREGDASTVPAALHAWMAQGAEILKAMTDEEVAELISTAGAALENPEAQGADVFSYAAGTDGLEKKGAKFSADTKTALDDCHKAAMDAHGAMGDAMKKLGSIWQGGESSSTPSKGGNNDAQGAGSQVGDHHKAEPAADLAKVQALSSELETEKLEKANLQKALDTVSATLKTTQDALAKAEAELKVKGAVKAVPIEKGSESQKLGGADTPAPSTDPVEVMKAAQSRPVSFHQVPR